MDTFYISCITIAFLGIYWDFFFFVLDIFDDNGDHVNVKVFLFVFNIFGSMFVSLFLYIFYVFV